MILAALFVLWVGVGVLQWRRAPKLLMRLKGIQPRFRKLWGTLLLGGSGLVLLLGLGYLFRLVPSGAFSTLQWSMVGLIGSVFVYCQTLAAAMLVSLGEFAVTSQGGVTSTPSSSEGNVSK